MVQLPEETDEKSEAYKSSNGDKCGDRIKHLLNVGVDSTDMKKKLCTNYVQNPFSPRF